MKKKVLGVLAAAVMAGMMTAGCAGKAPETNKETETETVKGGEEKAAEENTDEDKVIKIAGTASVSQVFYEAFKDKYEAQGYKTEFIPFDANPVCLEACASGEVDVSLGQQKKFMENFNKNNGADLAMVKPYGLYTGIGLYSNEYTSVEEIPDGSQIAVMNDASNEDVALRILENAGLIKIAEDIELATAADIVENPKNLKIIEMEQAQTVTALDDMAAACCWFTHMASVGKDPSSYLVRDDVMINYPMGVFVKSENAESDWAVAMAECFRDLEVQEKIEETFPEVFEFYTSDDQVAE